MGDQLSEFIREAARQRFSWRDRNCGLWGADWFRVRRGVDPAARLRAAAETELGAARLVRRLGGLVAIIDDMARETGTLRAHPPQRGDVVVARVARREVVAISLGGARVAALAPQGVYVGPADAVLAAWRV